MTTIEYLQSQASLCRQLSSDCFDLTMSTTLREMAEMHEERVRKEVLNGQDIPTIVPINR